jgi:hypothetical protein
LAANASLASRGDGVRYRRETRAIHHREPAWRLVGALQGLDRVVAVQLLRRIRMDLRELHGDQFA